jgi:sugar phosphate permease
MKLFIAIGAAVVIMALLLLLSVIILPSDHGLPPATQQRVDAAQQTEASKALRRAYCHPSVRNSWPTYCTKELSITRFLGA